MKLDEILNEAREAREDKKFRRKVMRDGVYFKYNVSSNNITWNRSNRTRTAVFYSIDILAKDWEIIE